MTIPWQKIRDRLPEDPEVKAIYDRYYVDEVVCSWPFAIFDEDGYIDHWEIRTSTSYRLVLKEAIDMDSNQE